MERRQSKREHRRQSHIHREVNHHRLMETEKREYGDLKRHFAHYDELSKETLAKTPLSGDDDYVRRWLTQTDNEVEAEASRGRTQKNWTEHRDTKQKPQLGLRSFRDAFPQNDTAQQQQHYSKEKRRHCSSSDSSLLEPVMKSDANSHKGVPQSATRQEAMLHRPKKRKVASSDSNSSTNSYFRHETFKKRDRHKTREDLYEPKKKKHQPEKQHGERRSKKKREKRGDKGKAARKAGEDLMNTFSSKCVAQNRLTIRPHGPGLFGNGRASSPARRRGLADLVFSEMEFLQHPPRYPEIEKTSKSREKEKKRTSREQDEISMFFRPSKTPLTEKSPNRKGERSSTYISEEHSMYIKQATADRPLERSQSIYISEKPYSGFGRLSPLSDRFSTSRGRASSMHQQRTAPDTTSRLSENPTVVTCSETQISPQATAVSRRWNCNYLHHASSTPEPIRISLESTGIFRDTGIKRTHRSVSSQAESGPPQIKFSCEKQDLRDVQHTLESSESTFRSATSQSKVAPTHSKLSSKDQQSQSTEQMPRPPRQYNLGIDIGPATEMLIRRENDKSPIRIDDPATTGLDQVIAQYNSSPGRHQQQESNRLEKTSAAPLVDVESLIEPKTASLSREQIARNARVEYPATNIPVETMLEEPTHHDGKTAALYPPTVSKEIIAKSGLINTVPVQYILQPTSVKTSRTTAPSELLPKSSFENCQVTHDSSGAQKSSRMEREFPHQGFSSTILPPQSGQRLYGMSRKGLSVPFNGRDTPILGPVNEATYRTGLTVRGPSRNGFGQPHCPLRMSPEVRNASLYLNQIQRQFLLKKPLFEDDAGIEQADNNHGVFNPEMVRNLEDNEYDMMEEQHHTARGYFEYPVDEDQEQFEYYAGHDASKPQMGQPIAQVDGMLEYSETWRGLESDMSNDCLVDGNYVHQGFAETYGVEEQRVDYENQWAEEVPMTGFWRPNRPF